MSFFNQDVLALPPSLAAFSPSERGVVVYTGYAVEKEIIFYCLYKKQVLKHWWTDMKQHIYSLSAFITMTVFVSTQFYWPIEGDCEIMMHWFNVCVFLFYRFWGRSLWPIGHYVSVCVQLEGCLLSDQTVSVPVPSYNITAKCLRAIQSSNGDVLCFRARPEADSFLQRSFSGFRIS